MCSVHFFCRSVLSLFHFNSILAPTPWWILCLPCITGWSMSIPWQALLAAKSPYTGHSQDQRVTKPWVLWDLKHLIIHRLGPHLPISKMENHSNACRLKKQKQNSLSQSHFRCKWQKIKPGINKKKNVLAHVTECSGFGLGSIPALKRHHQHHLICLHPSASVST